MIKRLVDETNQLKKIDIETVVSLIKQEWMRRLEEDGLSSGAPAEGMMSTMGYRVGDTQGIKQEYRIMIMIEILKGPLPFVESPSYMREWGSDGSLDRYNKLKRFLNEQFLCDQTLRIFSCKSTKIIKCLNVKNIKMVFN